MIMKKLSILFLAVLISCYPDNSPPVCEIIMPTEGSEYVRGESIEINVNAMDEDGAVTEVRLLIDEIGISSLGTFPYNFVYSSEEMEVGTHSIKTEAVDDDGEESEDFVSIVIMSALPEVETAQPNSITDSSAVVGGTIINDGGGSITRAGIIWGIEPYNGSDSNELAADVTGSSFSITLEDLQNENYFVIAFAENEIGRSYGEQISFNTLPQENVPPVCEIMLPVDGTLLTKGEDIEINVNAVDADGSISEVRLYIDEIGIASLHAFPYTYTQSSLEMAVGLHHIRVEAIDNDEAFSVDSVRVVLQAALPEVETAQPTSITTNSAVVGGTITDDGGGMISEAGILLGIESYDGTDMIEISADVIDNGVRNTIIDYGKSEIRNYRCRGAGSSSCPLGGTD